MLVWLGKGDWREASRGRREVRAREILRLV